MANTVVAIFDEIESARQVERYLLEKGYAPSEVNLKTAVYKQHLEDDAETTHDTDVLEGIKSFFKGLFGNDAANASVYHKVSHNRTIVTVHTTTNEDAEHVVGVLDSYGALDVHETAGSYHGDEDETRLRASAVKSRIVSRSSDHDAPIS